MKDTTRCYVDGRDLHHYQTGTKLRRASSSERLASIEAGEEGVILARVAERTLRRRLTR